MRIGKAISYELNFVKKLIEVTMQIDAWEIYYHLLYIQKINNSKGSK